MITHQVGNSYGNYNYNAFVYTNTSWNSHFHGNFELIYVFDGFTEIAVNGRQEVLFKGEMLLISPYEIHSLSVNSSSKIWIGVFSQDFVPDFAKRYRFSEFSKFRCKSADTEEFLKRNLFFQGVPKHYLHIACLYMACNECVQTAVVYESKRDSEFMHTVAVYVAQNLGQDISLKQMANELSYEYHYLSGMFNKCFSMNFKSFINIFRFESACKMLGDKNTDITQICNKCGFGSIRNFNRVFKNFSGYTPSQYRKMI